MALVAGNFSVAPAEILDSNILLSLSTISLLNWHSGNVDVPQWNRK